MNMKQDQDLNQKTNTSESLQNKELFTFLISEAEKPFSGWDFSYIQGTGRLVDSPLSWSYTSKVLKHIKKSESLLDMGTGGGEYLSMLQPLPQKTCATEGYKLNIPIARNCLEPLGVSVYEVLEDEQLPFEDKQFDLIINKHESYSAKEVFRTLKPGGIFITQQVGGRNHLDLNQLLGANEDFGHAHWGLDYALKEIQEAGFTVLEQKEDFPASRFYDVGAIVYYLKAVPWQIPDFTVEKYFNKLTSIHNMIQENGFLDVQSHRFLILAVKNVSKW
jgi:SAM-dependent methyltransferase